MGKCFSLAIDGPSGAGKSTIARKAAEKLGFIYVDTGAMYRTVGLAAYEAGIERKDEKRIAELLKTLQIRIIYEAGEQHMKLNGRDVSELIRRPEISVCASDVASLPIVRAFLLSMQRKFAAESNVIMDGRDIGTVVLPDADLKIFLFSTPEARAERRMKELQAKGIETSYEEVLRDICYRDKQDSERAAAPLKAADDAVMLDNSSMSFEDELDYIVKLVHEKRAAIENA